MSQSQDSRILLLYAAGDESAGREAEALYGYTCMRMARHILDHEKQAEACVRQAFALASERIHADRPASLELYLLRITRTLAMELFSSLQNDKRGDSLFLRVLDELGDCVPVRPDLYGLESSQEAEAARIGAALSAGLGKQKREARDLFICRYFYGESVSEITDRYGLSAKQAYTSLLRTRRKLTKHLEAAGIRGASSPEVTALALNHLDDAYLLSAHKPHKKLRRFVPALVAVGCVALLAVSFPYLREIIDTDLVLRSPDWRNDKENGDAEVPNKPDPQDILAMGSTVTVGQTTVTLEELTETTATYTVIKKDSIPLYAAVYDRMGDALACTEPDYRVDGVAIRHGTLRIYADGSEHRMDQIPTAPGTYRIVVDFTVVRNGTYPMEDYMGFYAYVGENQAPVGVFFTLELPEQPTEEATSGERRLFGVVNCSLSFR